MRIGDRDHPDGALKHNNPCNLVDWERRRLWPYLKGPDVFLSIGTGILMDVKHEHAQQFRHIFIDGFLPRIFRS